MADSIDELIRQVSKDVFDKINQNVSKYVATLEEEVIRLIGESMKKTRHYASLCNGKLAEDFGFPIGQGFIFADSVIKAVQTALQVIPLKQSNSIEITIMAFKTDLSDALSATMAKDPSNGDIDWLVWLLLRGNATILENWGIVKKGINSASSRSGKAIMAPVPSPLRIPFGVRKDMAGTRDNNWITEAAAICRLEVLEYAEIFLDKITKL